MKKHGENGDLKKMKGFQRKRIFPKKEKNFIKQFMTEFRILSPNVFYWKTHGEPMQTRGIPDIIACVESIFYGLEFKVMRHGILNITPYQEVTLKEIVNAGGFSFVIWWDEQSSNVGIQTKRFKGENAIKQAVEYVIKEMKQIREMIAKGRL